MENSVVIASSGPTLELERKNIQSHSVKSTGGNGPT